MAAATVLKRFAKELERGGKKTVVLGLLLVGGSYFWVPMLWKTVFPKRAGETPVATPNKPPATPKDPDDDDAPHAPAAAVEWKSLFRRLENAQAIQPVALEDLVRDPFDQLWIRERMLPPPTVKTEEVVQVADPLSGMKLTAVLVGSDGGAAIINNEVYRLGDHIPPEGPVRYVVKSISPDKVVLERDGNSFELAARPNERKQK